ncbi:MAG: hypothetical protein NXI29_08795 [bacterium]|nr:hypothetical protein [bacterium]
MLSRIFAILVCLAGLQVVCSAEENPRQAKADHEKVSVTGDQTLEFGPFVLQGEDLKVRLRRKGQRSIVISGNARLVCGNTRFIAQSIEASWKNSDEMYFNLWGNVEIQNISGQLRMYAPQAALFHDQDGHIWSCKTCDRGLSLCSAMPIRKPRSLLRSRSTSVPGTQKRFELCPLIW